MFRANPFLVYRMRWLAAIALITTASFASQRGAIADGDVDRKTGMKFPARIGSFKREGRIEYDAAGYPEATYLLGRAALASVFYYRAAPFPTEYANARDAVEIKTPSARLVSDGRSNLHPGGRRAVFTFQETFLGEPNVKLFSELLMFPHQDFYLTFRVTYVASQAKLARQQIDGLVRGFKMPLASSKAAE